MGEGGPPQLRNARTRLSVHTGILITGATDRPTVLQHRLASLAPSASPVECGTSQPLTTHLGLIRLATTMMSLTLAEVFILAPEPIVMATSFSVRV